MTDNLFAFTRAAAAHLADGGLFRLDPERALAGRIEGAGARAALAVAAGRLDGLGTDLVARLVNAVVAEGAEPLFVLARVAGARIDENSLQRLTDELHAACIADACALVALEHDDAPGVYHDARLDVSAGIVARVDAGHSLDVDGVRAGDALIGLLDPSLNARGCALALDALAYASAPDGEPSALAETLLEPQPSYRAAMHAIRSAAAVRSTAYIAKNLYDDVPRALPEGVAAVFEPARWHVPQATAAVVSRAGLAHDAAFRALGMGIGFVLIVPLTDIATALAASSGARVVGFVQPRRASDPAVVVRAPRAPR